MYCKANEEYRITKAEVVDGLVLIQNANYLKVKELVIETNEIKSLPSNARAKAEEHFHGGIIARVCTDLY